MTRGQKGEGSRMDPQNGAAPPSTQKRDKLKEGQHKQQKGSKDGSADHPKDIRYYAQKLSEKSGLAAAQSLSECPDFNDTEEEECVREQGAGAMLTQGEVSDAIADEPEEHEEEEEGSEQPTLADILKAVNKCTASVNNLQVRFGGLKEEVSLIRQDIQKIRERTTAAESRISELEDKLPTLIRDSQSTTRLARATDTRAEDFENRLRRNNVRIVGLPEKVEGRDPTQFIEQ